MQGVTSVSCCATSTKEYWYSADLNAPANGMGGTLPSGLGRGSMYFVNVVGSRSWMAPTRWRSNAMIFKTAKIEMKIKPGNADCVRSFIGKSSLSGADDH